MADSHLKSMAKAFSWRIEQGQPILVVRMTNTRGDSKQYVELAFNGVTGDLVEEILQPARLRPCRS